MGEVSVDDGYRVFGIGFAQKYINDITILLNNNVLIRDHLKFRRGFRFGSSDSGPTTLIRFGLLGGQKKNSHVKSILAKTLSVYYLLYSVSPLF